MSFLFKNISVLDESFNILSNQYVLIENDIIKYIGDNCPEFHGNTFNGKGCLLMSAFFNAHSHLPMSLMRGYGENLNLSDWLFTKIFPFEEKLNSNDIYYASLLGIAEMLRYGIASTSDMYFLSVATADAFIDSKAKCNIAVCASGLNEDISFSSMQSYKNAEEIRQKLLNINNDKIIMEMGLHAEYTTSPKLIKEVLNYSEKYNLGVHIHLSETKSEHEDCKKRHNGKTPTALFDSLGLDKFRTTAAHCVWLEDKDFEILKKGNYSIVTCPKSNLKLASGICDVQKFLDNSINVALGTDSVASNNNLNFIEELRFLALTQKYKNFNPCTLSPKEALKIATTNGAIAQGRANSGILKINNKADLIVLNIDTPFMKNGYDILTDITYTAMGNDIELTMVDGNVLYEKGEFKSIDIDKVLYQTEKIKKRILNEI